MASRKKKLSLSSACLLLGVIIGYLVGDQLVNFQKLLDWRNYLTDIIGVLLAGMVVFVVLFPSRAPIVKYYLGQVGGWLASLIMGGWLPLLKAVVYSFDFWTIVILVPIHTGVIATLLLVQNWLGFHAQNQFPSCGKVTTESCYRDLE